MKLTRSFLLLALSAALVSCSPHVVSETFEGAQNEPDAGAMARLMKAEHRRLLEERGLLKGALRLRDANASLADQARKVEVFCGFQPESILQVRDGRVVINGGSNDHVTFDKFQILLAVMDVVNLDYPYGVLTQESD